MDILCLQLSPRQGGNSDTMLAAFSQGLAETGLKVIKFSVAEHRVEPCLGCSACDDTGQCAISDDLGDLYPLMAEAENVVVSTSIYFYDVPAKGKALIDRAQALWARRYLLNQKEMSKPGGRGFLLALGATRGENLFIPVSLSVRYFFDALGLPKTFETLFFRGLDKPGELARQPDKLETIREAGLAFGRRISADRAGRT